MQPSDLVPALAKLAELIRTQDGACTSLPMFCVQKKVRIYGLDTDYTDSVVWLDCENDEVDEETFERLESLYDDGLTEEDDEDEEDDSGHEIKNTSGYTRVGYQDTWEFVTAFLTRDAADAYIRANRHRMKEPRIYVESGYRNAEWEILRELPALVLAEIERLTAERGARCAMSLDHANLRALAEAATQDWFVVDDGSDRPRALTFDGRNSLLGLDVDGMAIVTKQEDAAFIGACTPRVVRALLAEIERLTALVPVEIPSPAEPDGWGWYVPDTAPVTDGFETRDAAIADAIREGAIGFYVGEMRAVRLANHVSADDLREYVEERAADNLSLEDFHVALGPVDEANRALNQWVLRYLEPDGPTYCEGAEVTDEEIALVRAAMTTEAPRGV